MDNKYNYSYKTVNFMSIHEYPYTKIANHAKDVLHLNFVKVFLSEEPLLYMVYVQAFLIL